MAKDPKTDPKNFYPRYATDHCVDCNDFYYTKWGRVRQTNYDLFLPENTIIAACRNEKGFYPFRDERGLGMSELREPHYSTLAASGALSLGTTAGTDRSISAEFGGTTPHGLSEYYDAAIGIPASGTIDFSDFHGTSAITPPAVTNCLHTHYDFAECTENTSLSWWETTDFACETQRMTVGAWCPNTHSWYKKFCPNTTACICKYNNGIHTNKSYLLMCNFNGATTCSGCAYWGDQVSPFDNTVFFVFMMCGGSADSSYLYTNIRLNTAMSAYNIADPYYSSARYTAGYFNAGHTWSMEGICYWKEVAWSGIGAVRTWFIYGADNSADGAYPYFCINNVIVCPFIMGHAIGVNANQWSTPTMSQYQPIVVNQDTCQFRSWTSGGGYGINYSNNSSRRYQGTGRASTDTYPGGGGDYWTFPFCYCSSHGDSRLPECTWVGEYLNYSCQLTVAEQCAMVEYLTCKWYLGCD